MNNSFENEIILVKKGFQLIQEIGWEEFSFEKMSKILKISDDELKKIFRCKNSILSKFSIMIDNYVEAKISSLAVHADLLKSGFLLNEENTFGIQPKISSGLELLLTPQNASSLRRIAEFNL